jgi:hypothetical protein
MTETETVAHDNGWPEVSSFVQQETPAHVPHLSQTVTVAGHSGGSSTRDGATGFGRKAEWMAAMNIYWMTNTELAQAIPPPYTKYIGLRLLDEIQARYA